MTILDLEDKLRERVKEALGSLKLKNRKGNYQLVKVIKGTLTPEKIINTKDISYEKFPLVMVGFHKLDEETEAIAKCKIFIGICAKEENKEIIQEKWDEENYQKSHYDLLTCISKIRQNLLSDKNLDGALIRKPFKVECFLEQPYPCMYAEIDLKLEFNTIDPTTYID